MIKGVGDELFALKSVTDPFSFYLQLCSKRIYCKYVQYMRFEELMNKLLKKLHQDGKVWTAAQAEQNIEMLDSGYKKLNEKLYGGFPVQGVIEVQSLAGIGELRLFMPFLQNLLKQESIKKRERKIVFIAPPAQLNALMLAKQHIDEQDLLVICSEQEADSLWAAEQCLKSGCCLAVFLWHQCLAIHQVKRLKQAAVQGKAVQVLFRSQQSLDLNLPVSLSLALSPHDQGLTIEVKKQLGRWPSKPFVLSMQERWPCLTLFPLADNVIPLSKGKLSNVRVG